MDLTSSTCGCGRAATLCHRTCAPCRLRALVARAGVSLVLPAELDEPTALSAERSVREGLAAIDRARNAIARAAGVPTRAIAQSDGASVVHTFGLATEAHDAP